MSRLRVSGVSGSSRNHPDMDRNQSGAEVCPSQFPHRRGSRVPGTAKNTRRSLPKVPHANLTVSRWHDAGRNRNLRCLEACRVYIQSSSWPAEEQIRFQNQPEIRSVTLKRLDGVIFPAASHAVRWLPTPVVCTVDDFWPVAMATVCLLSQLKLRRPNSSKSQKSVHRMGT